MIYILPWIKVDVLKEWIFVHSWRHLEGFNSHHLCFWLEPEMFIWLNQYINNQYDKAVEHCLLYNWHSVDFRGHTFDYFQFSFPVKTIVKKPMLNLYRRMNKSHKRIMTHMKDTSLLNCSCKKFDLSDGFITLQNAVNYVKRIK